MGLAALLLLSSVPPSGAVALRRWVAAIVRRFIADPVGSLRRSGSQVVTWLQRGVPDASAEAAGLFRIVFGTCVVLFVATDRVYPEMLQQADLGSAEGPYGAIVRWLNAHPQVVGELDGWLKISGALFIVGFCTAISFACFTAAFLLWACVYTLGTSAHAVASLQVAMICLVAARWGDAWSVDAWLRRLRRQSPTRSHGTRYGFAIWIPRLVLGVTFLAAAWSKTGGGPAWILNGSVKYHFVSDLNYAWVDWGLRLTQYHWIAVAMSAFAVVVELLLITAAFARSDTYRLMLAAATLTLFGGFAIFQGVLWWSWWILLLAFLPWQRIRADVGSPATLQTFRPVHVAVVIVVLAQQLVVSATSFEARPLLSAYDMYSATYRTAEEYENATNLVYRVVAYDNGTRRELPSCTVDDRTAAALPAAAAGAPAERARLRALLRRCLQASDAVTAFALEGDREVYNWKERRFEVKRALHIIGPVSADWLH
jgi:hypothetical protein